jgi:hypothetical protein
MDPETAGQIKIRAQMKFLRPMLGLTRLDHQRNEVIREKLKVKSIVSEIDEYRQNWKSHVKEWKISDSQKQHFTTNLVAGEIQEYQLKDGQTSEHRNRQRCLNRKSQKKKKKSLFRIIFWGVLPCKCMLERRFRGVYCHHHQE